MSFIVLAVTQPALLIPHLITFDNVDYSAEIFAVSIVICMLMGIFISMFFGRISNKKLRILFAVIFSTLIVIYFFDADQYSQKYDIHELELKEMLEASIPLLNPSDRILSTNASQMMLGAYNTIRPIQIDTANWFVYKEKSEREAIELAITDGYFSVIQIENSPENHWIITEVKPNYEQVFKNKSYIVYRRSF